MPVIHPLTAQLSISSAVAVSAVVVVRNPSELREALRQHAKPIVIDDPKMERAFSRAMFWQGREGTIRFVAILFAGVICLAIALGYRIDGSWSRDWKLDRLDGKITLTPSVKP
jgi:hypothetical protein